MQLIRELNVIVGEKCVKTAEAYSFIDADETKFALL